MRGKLSTRIISLIMAAILIAATAAVPVKVQAHSNEPSESFSLYKDGHKEFVLDVDACIVMRYVPVGSSSHFSYDPEKDALKVTDIRVTRRDATAILDQVSAIYVSGDCKIPVVRTDCLSNDWYGNPPYCSAITVYMDPGSTLEIDDLYDYNMKDVPDSQIKCGPGVKMKKTRDGKALKYTFTSGGLEVGKKAKVGGVKYQIVSDDGIGAEIIKGKAAKKVKVGDSVKIKGASYNITSIGKGAYKNKKNIKEIALGANIKTIKKEAFFGCSNVKTITMKVGNLKSIEKNAFKKLNKKCKFILIGTDEEIAQADYLIRKSSTGFKATMTTEGKPANG